MTLTQIHCFLCAAETKSFSKAGEKLFITRPAVSKQVSQLEAEIGFPLFRRVHGGLEITEAGQEVYRVFRRTYDEMNDVLSLGRRMHENAGNALRIGYLWGWDFHRLFSRLITCLEEEMPGQAFSFDGYGFDMLSFLRRGDLDFIISIDAFFHMEPALRYQRLATVRAALLYSKRRRQPEGRPLRLGDFRDDLFFVSGDPASPERYVRPLREACEKEGFEPRIEIVNDGRLMRRIQNGQGVWITDDLFSSYSGTMVDRVPLDLTYDICLAWMPPVREDPKKSRFIEAVQRFCQEQLLPGQTDA